MAQSTFFAAPGRCASTRGAGVKTIKTADAARTPNILIDCTLVIDFAPGAILHRIEADATHQHVGYFD
jgi:hypothetical protein